jgi:vacuolar protein sorting-associated protein 13A/C
MILMPCDQADTVRTYPRMTLRLRAPLEVENLLPYDIKFRIHDKHSGLSSSNWLSKGLASPIHTVEVSHLMLISISAEDTSQSPFPNNPSFD